MQRVELAREGAVMCVMLLYLLVVKMRLKCSVSWVPLHNTLPPQSYPVHGLLLVPFEEGVGRNVWEGLVCSLSILTQELLPLDDRHHHLQVIVNRLG